MFQTHYYKILIYHKILLNFLAYYIFIFLTNSTTSSGSIPKPGFCKYSKEEIDIAIALKEISKKETDFKWTQKYTSVGKMEKLREYVGLEKWSHLYKLASKLIHADFYEMNSLMAMSEAKENMLLVGQSNSGMTEPAHITAITLNQITSAFLTAYIKDESTENFD